jgi:hypothetical protein
MRNRDKCTEANELSELLFVDQNPTVLANKDIQQEIAMKQTEALKDIIKKSALEEKGKAIVTHANVVFKKLQEGVTTIHM